MLQEQVKKQISSQLSPDTFSPEGIKLLVLYSAPNTLFSGMTWPHHAFPKPVLCSSPSLDHLSEKNHASLAACCGISHIWGTQLRKILTQTLGNLSNNRRVFKPLCVAMHYSNFMPQFPVVFKPLGNVLVRSFSCGEKHFWGTFEEPAALALMAEPRLVLWGKITSAAVTAIWFCKQFKVLPFQQLAFKNKTSEAFGGFFSSFSKHYATATEFR